MPTISFTDQERSLKVDFEGRWKKIKGHVVKIRGYDFVFAIIHADHANLLMAYPVDSRELFDYVLVERNINDLKNKSKLMYWHESRLATKISHALDGIKGGAKSFKKIFESERLVVELMCNRKENEDD